MKHDSVVTSACDDEFVAGGGCRGAEEQPAMAK